MRADTSTIITKIQKAIYIFYILVIFEGALRKWILPGLSSPLFFIKDPFVLYTYYLCWKYRMFPKGKLASFSYYFSLIFFLLGFVQAFIESVPLIVIFYGWRSYFFYMPFAFIIAEYSDMEFLKKIAAFTCYVAIPIAILTYIQYKSPPNAFINRGVGESKRQVFTVVRDVVRTYGTFSFTNGQTMFIASILTFLLFNYFLGPSNKFIPDLISYISSLAFFSNLAVSGSRSAYANCAIIFAFLIFSSLLLITRKKSASIISFSIVAIVVAVLVFNAFFTEQLAQLAERQALASGSEGSFLKRALSAFFVITDADIPYWGYGLGVGSIGGSLLATGDSAFTLAESEWARIELECGYIFGLAYIVYRIALTFIIIKEAFQATVSSSNPAPLIVASYIWPIILFGQLTMNGSTMAYGWLYLGISLAVNKTFINKDYITSGLNKVEAT